MISALDWLQLRDGHTDASYSTSSVTVPLHPGIPNTEEGRVYGQSQNDLLIYSIVPVIFTKRCPCRLAYNTVEDCHQSSS